MRVWMIFLILAVIGGVVAIVSKARSSKRDNSPEGMEADRKKEAEYRARMAPGEELVAVAAIDYKSRFYIAVSNQKLYVESKKGVAEIPINTIRKITLKNSRGDKTSISGDSIVATVKADKTYNFSNMSSNYEKVVDYLMQQCEG